MQVSQRSGSARTLIRLLVEGVSIRRRHFTQKVDVLVRVELGHLPFGSRLCTLVRYRGQRQTDPCLGLPATHEDLHLLI